MSLPRKMLQQLKDLDFVLQNLINLGQVATGGEWTVRWCRAHEKDFNGATVRDGQDNELARIPNEVHVESEKQANTLLLAGAHLLPMMASMLQEVVQKLSADCAAFNFPDEDRPVAFGLLQSIIKKHKEWEQSRETHA